MLDDCPGICIQSDKFLVYILLGILSQLTVYPNIRSKLLSNPSLPSLFLLLDSIYNMAPYSVPFSDIPSSDRVLFEYYRQKLAPDAMYDANYPLRTSIQVIGESALDALYKSKTNVYMLSFVKKVYKLSDFASVNVPYD